MTVRSTSVGLLLALALTGYVERAHAGPDDVAPNPEASPVDLASRERSRAAFRRGVTQLRAQDWAGARLSFEEAWSLVQHPSILLNLGIARLRTDDPVLAEQDLVRFLSEDPGAAADELASAREALAEARSKIGTLRIGVTPAFARVLVDGKAVGVRTQASANGEGGIAETRLNAGRHAVKVEAEGFRPSERAVDLPPRSETDVRVALTAREAAKSAPTVAPPTSARVIVGWSLAGASGLALATSGFMGIRAMSLSSDYADRGSASFQNRDVKEEGLTFRTGADVALVTAILAGAGAVILLLTDIGASADAGVARAVPARGAPRSPIAQPALLRW